MNTSWIQGTSANEVYMSPRQNHKGHFVFESFNAKYGGLFIYACYLVLPPLNV